MSLKPGENTRKGSVVADGGNPSFHLVRNPDLIDRLEAEIAEAIPPNGEHITRKHIQKLPFLRCCINESKPHQLHPS